MNLNHLFYFKVLAQTENYTEAAQQLIISQPSLSYAIKKLEEDLGVPLFEKKGRNVFLTKYGKELHKTTETSLNLISQTIEHIQKQHNHEDNTLTVGIVSTLASNFLPEIINQSEEKEIFMQDLQVFPGYTKDILKKLEQGVYDIGLCSKEEHPNLTFIPVKKQPFVLLINKDFYKKNPNVIANWFQLPIITYRENLPIGRSVRKIMKAYTNSPNIIKEFDDETSIGGFVSVNPCVAIVAKTSLLRQFDLPTIPLDEEKLFHTVYLSYQTKNKDLKKIKKFLPLIEAHGDF